MVTDSDVGLAIINAVLTDVTTKGDLEKLRNEIRREVSRLEGQMNLFVKLFTAFNLPTLIAVIGILLRMVFS